MEVYTFSSDENFSSRISSTISFTVLPSLSVTPGLNPIFITNDGLSFL